MIINSAILHIFDFISDVCIYSQKEIDLREDDIEAFIKKHVKNALSDPSCKEGSLNSNSSFLSKLNEYTLIYSGHKVSNSNTYYIEPKIYYAAKYIIR